MIMGQEKFDIALRVFVEGCQNIHTDHMAKQFPGLTPDEISSKLGKRYAKIIRRQVGSLGSSVHCFVDMTNGDVLKAAGWKAPAKHARGNIFDEHHGLKNMNEYGPAYLR
jgi:hypothetical protein